MTSSATRWALLGAAEVTAVGVGVGVGRMVVRRRQRHQPGKEDGWYVVRRGVTVDRPCAGKASAS